MSIKLSDLTEVSELKDHIGEEVSLGGWCYNSRISKNVKFVVLRDGTGYVQCVFTNSALNNAFDRVDEISQETSLYIKGKVVQHPKQENVFEIEGIDFEIINKAIDYPITPKEHGIEFLFDRRHLHLRSAKPHAVLRIRHRIVKAIRDFFDSRGFTLLDSPILTANAGEGTGNLFSTPYFDFENAYLAQTGQLYGEAGAMSLRKIYTFGPTFRAEKSKTRRHLTEFWMIEPEVAFLDLEGNMRLAEDYISYIIASVLTDCQEELKRLERDTTKLESVVTPFPRISYTESVELLKIKIPNWNLNRKSDQEEMEMVKWGDDFGAPHETLVAEDFDRPVIIHHYPTEIKAFYMKRDDNNPLVVKAMDVIAPEGYGEIIGGSQREENIEFLQQRIKDEGLPMDAFEWYLDLRRFGSVPHSGFGMGLERVVAWVCGLDHIREAIPFPRTMNRLTP
ncbi:MAG: asparagine--tRNA ligase [Chlorobiota bacterium]|nr:asparagine--tRNA ligase [Chlorobiota bacterium]QQS67252.1 MAG: asparagine--tRNA ligase [Chlorobiota bacterium]